MARADGTPTLPRAKTKRKTKKTTRTVPDDASPWVATAEGTLPERESVAPSRRPTSLGDGVVKVAGTRIAWAQLLRRIYRVDVLTCRCGGRRAIVAENSERNVIVAILAHLKLPTEALPLARARSPAFEGAGVNQAGPWHRPRGPRCAARAIARERGGLGDGVLPSSARGGGALGGVGLAGSALFVLSSAVRCTGSSGTPSPAPQTWRIASEPPAGSRRASARNASGPDERDPTAKGRRSAR